MINKQTIQEIFETVKVEEVIADFISLKKRGVNYIGSCPFHQEKTPSFTVSPAKGIYKCFGCGKAGNSVNFIMDHEQYSYPEALRYLARKYNIEIEEEEQTPDQLEAISETESLFNLSSYAQKYFSDILWENEEGQAIGLSYFRERAFSDAIIKKFQLGFSPDKPDVFTQHALSNGYQIKHLLKTGISVSGDNKPYDRFRGRVIFPIHNITGRVLGFGGRILRKDNNKAKYVNSPESDIYSKSKVLYGLYFAKNAIISKDNCFLVEGYTDVISLFQAGVENVVASSGTSLTTEQIKLIKRYTRNVTILYDGDPAGIKAAFRGIDMILEEGMNVRIVFFPEGEDPDSFARKNESDELKEFITKQAQDFVKFKTELLLKEAANDPIKKSESLNVIIQTIAIIQSNETRNIYIKECSEILDLQEKHLFNAVEKVRTQNHTKKIKQKIDVDETIPEIKDFSNILKDLQPEKDLSAQEKEIIRLLLNFGQKEIIFEYKDENKRDVLNPVVVAVYIASSLLDEEYKFSDPLYQLIFDEYVSGIEKGALPEDTFFINHENATISRLAIELFNFENQLSPNWFDKHKIEVPTELEVLKQSVESSVFSLLIKKVDQMITENQKELGKSSEEDVSTILTKHKKLLETRSELAKMLGNIIILK